jgi:SET domain-containing protein
VGTSEHIVIESLRTIYAGEELTYDYQFPFEEDKVKCFCRAPNCRGTMN